jgi:hypothetical protein
MANQGACVSWMSFRSLMASFTTPLSFIFNPLFRGLQANLHHNRRPMSIFRGQKMANSVATSQPPVFSWPE